MLSTKRVFIIFSIAALIFTGAWAIAQQSEPSNDVSPSNFDPLDSRDLPETTTVDFEIKGITRYGKIYMIEGLENESQVINERNSLTSGITTYPSLIVHGVFSDLIRDWRNEVISGTFTKREIEIDLINSRNDRVLRIRVINAWPRSFSFPPLNVDGSTRYMERIEFIYDRFEISN
jgi:phage tail-like protein